MVRIFSITAIIAMLAISCGTNDNPSDENIDDFDRKAMLVNLADNIIIPAHQDLNVRLKNLVTAKDNFITAVNQSSLDALRTSWLEAYKVWQYIEMFNIGKAEEIRFYNQMNIYPTSTDEIENNIATGTYDLTHVNNYDAVGFPALDYLINGVAGTDSEIIERYSTHVDAAKYKSHLTDIVNQMKSLTETVLNDWTSTYRDIFVNSSDNTASSAANSLINDFIFYYEKGFRANKIGIPAGIYSATPLEDKVEAVYYKVASKGLALEGLKAVQGFFNGKHYNNTSSGESFSTYLEHLNRTDLATSINGQFDIARSKVEAMEDSFISQINTDNTKMTQTFDDLQVAVVMMKVEMLNVFSINIDYVDGDGD